ncbi:MAG: amino acid adenylation domain-containing protein [Bacilli bacterium]|nr:amino acid adenylation domain-containing protein [Bacilli bacterium]
MTVQTIQVNGNNELVAYVATKDKAIKDKVIKYVASHKPAYMVPSHVMVLDKIPLNVNGKVDKRALPKVDVSSKKVSYVAPTNDVEKTICDAFAKVFNLKQVGVNDDFNLLGGDSIKAIRLVSVLNSQHLIVEANQILSLRTPKAISSAISQKEMKIYDPVVGEIGLSPIQEYFFNSVTDKDNYKQFYVVEAAEPLDLDRLQKAFNQLTNLQDQLRASYVNHQQIIRPLNTVVSKITAITTKENIQKAIIHEIDKSIASLSLKNNHLIDIKLINNRYLVLTIHHLIIDGVSWSILLDNLTLLYEGKEFTRPYPYSSFIKDIRKYSSGISQSTIEKYQSINDLVDEEAIKGSPIAIADHFKSSFVSNNPYELSENDYLLLAIARAYKKTYGRDIICGMESHGRDETLTDVNQTIGWCTAIYPSLFEVSTKNSHFDLINDLCAIKKATVNNAHLGIDYLVSCYYLKQLKFKHSPVTFNFLSDEFSYNNHLFRTLSLDNDKEIAQRMNVAETIYGLTLNISKSHNEYIITGTCPKHTYLSDKYQSFIANLKLEAKNIATALNSKTYVYPLYEEPLGVYLDEKVNNKGTSYSCFGYVKFEQKISLDTAKAKISQLLDFHPVLKTRILDVNGLPYGLTDGEVGINVLNKNFAEIDLNDLVLPFNFAKSLSRFFIIQSKNNTYLAYDMHHMISDASSRFLINKELTGEITKKIDLGFMKKAYANLKRDYQDLLKLAKEFYERDFVDSGNIIELIDDINNDYGGLASVYLGDIKEKLIALANRLSITPNNILTSAFAYTLSRFINNDKVYFTFTNHGRDLDGLDAALGMYVKTIPIVLNTNNKSVDDYLKGSSKHILDAMKHSVFPFRLVASEYHLKKNVSFEYNTNLNDVTGVSESIYYKPDKEKHISHVSHLLGVINDYQNGYVLSIEHSSRYTKNTIIRFLKTYQKIIIGLLNNKELKDINYTLDEDLSVFNKINATSTKLVYHDILEAFNNSLKKYPNNTLVTYLDNKYTYKEGAKWINNLTNKLNNIPQGSNIAILTHRSHYYLLTALAVLNHGSTYVPIDDTYPDERIKFMLKDSGAKCVLVTSEMVSRIKTLTDIPFVNVSDIRAIGELKPLKINTNEDSVAIILYTSGTTGTPKGSLITRRAILNLAEWYVHDTKLTNHDIYSMYVSYVFDMHTLGFYTPLIVGASLDIVPFNVRLNLNDLNKHFNKVGGTHTYMTAQVGKLYAEGGYKTPIKLLCFGGMKLGELHAPNSIGAFESYGPTENLAITTSIFANKRIHHSSIGNFIHNVKGYILDHEHRLVPYGAMGELYLSGYQLAKGYLNRKKENEAAFFKNPFTNEKGYEVLYKTGDIVRLLPDHTLGIIGRVDSQVKIRGNRVELGEVETCIKQVDGVIDVTVQTIQVNGNNELVAYVATKDKAIKDKVIKYVASHKPAYMVPSHVMVLDKIPLNVNGKVDKRALPKVDVSSKKVSYVAPTNDVEKTICDAFAKVFNLKQVGVNDDFLSLGGDSLTAIRLLAFLKDYQLTAADITNLKTPRLISEKISGSKSLSLDLNKYSLVTGAPLSEQQLNIYLDIVMNKKVDAYLIPLVTNLEKYSSNDVIKALDKMFEIHPILKGYVDNKNDTPFIKIGKKPNTKVVDNNTKIDLTKFLSTPFDIYHELSRFLYCKENKTLYAVFHHMIFDGLSTLVFSNHLLAILNKKEVEPDLAFLKASAFSQEIKKTNLYQEAEIFYEKEFVDSEKIVEPLPDIGEHQPSYTSLKLKVDQKRIDSFIKRHEITKNVLFTSVFAYTLSRFTNTNDAYFTMIENGRSRLDAREAIGMFVNTLPLLIDCSNDSIANFIKKSKEKIYQTINYNFYPFRLLNNKYRISANVLFQYQPGVKQTKSMNDKGFIGKDDLANRNDFNAELSFVLSSSDTDNYLDVIAGKKYASSTIKKILLTYERILCEFLIKDNLKDINYTLAEDIKVIDGINSTRTKLKYHDILEAFNNSLKKHPNHILVSYFNEKYTYAEGAKWINKLDDIFISKKIKRYSHIAVFPHRSHYYQLGALAVENYNSAYVPIDEAYPNDRIKFMITDTAASAILVTNQTLDRAKEIIKDFKVKPLIINMSEVIITNQDKVKPLTAKIDHQDVACILYTSGTTGIPKGALILHKGIINTAQRYATQVANLCDTDKVTLYASVGFDVHMEALHSPIFAGATLDITPTNVRLDPIALLKHFETHHVTHVHLPTSLTKILINHEIPSCMKQMVTGGAPLGKVNTNLPCDFKDVYGPTEATINVAAIRVKDKIDPTSVGKPLMNSRCYILDKEHRLTPFGGVGDLYLCGYQVCKGYLNRDKENKEAFFKNPFTNEEGYERIYRSGDVARYLPDGTIAYLGRKDSQVKIRGNRVELGEIEVTIRKIKEVKDVTVQVIVNDGNKELVAYVVSSNKDIKNIIINYVRNNQPEYMVPSHVMVLDKIPLNVNGKVDKRALPKVDVSSKKVSYVAPTNDVEKTICDAFAKVFNLKQVGVNDDFLSLGGDSLTAIRLLAFLKDYQLTAADITNLKTPRLISEKISGSKSLSLDLNKYSLVTGAPLSEQQLNIYLDIVMNKKVESYLNPLVFKYDKYTSNDIKNALTKLFKCHPILTGYIENDSDNNPYLKIGHTPMIEVLKDLRKNDINSYIAEPFNIHKSLSRFLIDENSKTLYAVFHHIIFDALSRAVFRNHLLAILNKKEVEPDLAFLKASAFSQEIKKTNLYQEAEIFYEKEFVDSEKIVEPLPDIGEHQPSYTSLKLKVDQKRIDSFIKRHEITKNVLFTSVFAYTLSRFTNTNDAYFTMIENGRSRLDAREAIGMFVNTLPLLIDCSNDSIANFIKKSKEKIYQTINYNFYPFRLLKNKYNLSANIDFQYQPNNFSSHLDTNAHNLLYRDNLKKRTDLISDLAIVATDNEINIVSSKKYAQSTIKKMLSTYEQILNEILVKNSLADINYTLNEDLSVFNKINATSTKLVYHDILEAFNHSLKKYPNNTLVSYLDTKYTYSEGAKWINNLTNKLNNVPKKSNIAILTHRSHFYLLTALSVLNHGSAYVPIDDTYPDERIKFMLKDSNAKVVLVTDETINRVKKLTNIPVINVSDIKSSGTLKPLKTNNKDDLAAVILYTSGTTGTPKGTILPRKAILNLAEWCAHFTSLTKTDVFALYVSIGFDVHIGSLYSPLLTGASLNVIPTDIRLDPNQLINYFNQYHISHVFSVTALTRILLDNQLPKELRVMFTGGEALGEVNQHLTCSLYDAYGPTESTVLSTVIDVKKKISASSVGHLLANIKGYVLDHERRLVPYGAMGELYLSGYQLAKGYLNRDKENKEAFYLNPFSKEKGYERMYKTGDIVRYLPDGTFGFIGRVDSQVKIRGNRVELGEVEATIREVKEVKDVTVQTMINNNNKELVAYLVSSDKAIKDKVIKYVASHKPAYMVPSHVMVLDKIPLNVNGKVDKRALPKVDVSANIHSCQPPRNKLEQRMVDCAKNLFKLASQKIGIDTNMNNLGLDSLIALRLSLLYKARANISIGAIDIINNPTIEKQIAFVKKFTYQPIHTFNLSKGKKHLFFVHPGQGGSESYQELAKLLGKNVSFSVFEHYNLFHLNQRIKGIKNIAKYYVKLLKAQQPHGPYYLGGYSYGGNIAYEMAVILAKDHEEVRNLFLLDSATRSVPLSKEEMIKLVDAETKNITIKQKNLTNEMATAYKTISLFVSEDLNGYSPSRYDGEVTFFKANKKNKKIAGLPKSTYQKISSSRNLYLKKKANFIICDIDASHDELLDEKPRNKIAKIIVKQLLN